MAGNVRELRNVLERALILRDEEDRIRAGDIDLGATPALPERVAGEDAVDTIVVPRSGLSLDDLERRLLLKALEVCAGHRGRAARFLGLGATLWPTA